MSHPPSDESNHLDRFSNSLSRLNAAQPWMNEINLLHPPNAQHHHGRTNGFAKPGRPRYQDFKTKSLAKRSPSSTSADGRNSRQGSTGSRPYYYHYNPGSSSGLSAGAVAQPVHNNTSSSIESFRSAALHSPLPPTLATHAQRSRATPYTGWRSSECLDQERIYLNPSERLASSLHHRSRSFSHDRLQPGLGGRHHREVGHLRELPTYKIHDSIRSVTSAIMEYCGTEPAAQTTQRAPRRLLLMETSFVSAPAPKTNNNNSNDVSEAKTLKS